MAHNQGHTAAATLLPSWAIAAGFLEENIKFGLASLPHSGRDRNLWGKTMNNRCKNDDVWKETVRKAGAIQSNSAFVVIYKGGKAFINNPAAILAMPSGEMILL